MADFVCKVADTSGRIFSQVEAAQSMEEVRQKLSDRGFFVYSVEARGGFMSAGGGTSRSRTVKEGDFLVFNQQFNTLIKAGLPILKALELLAERAATPRLRPLLQEVRARVREGASLSEALEAQGSFPKVYVTAVLAGEKSGNLPGVLDYYIAYQRVSTGVRKKLIATLIYPVILVVVATAILTYLVTYVVPQFAKLYADMNVQLPTVTRMLLTLTVTYRAYFGAAVALIIARYRRPDSLVPHGCRRPGDGPREAALAGGRRHLDQVSSRPVLPHPVHAACRRHSSGDRARYVSRRREQPTDRRCHQAGGRPGSRGTIAARRLDQHQDHAGPGH